MRFIFALAAFAATAAAAPWANWGVSHGLNYPRTTSNCMSDSDATKVANNFKTLIAAYSDSFSNKTMAVDFVDYSDSVMELINGGCEGPEVVCLHIPSPSPAAGLRDFVHLTYMRFLLPCSSALPSSHPEPNSRPARVRSLPFHSRSSRLGTPAVP